MTAVVTEGLIEEVAFELKPEGREQAIHGKAEEEYSRQSLARTKAWRLEIESNQCDYRVGAKGKSRI